MSFSHLLMLIRLNAAKDARRATVKTTKFSFVTMAASSTRKLHGRAFYESIGSPKCIVAPMVDRSDFVSDSICQRTI